MAIPRSVLLLLCLSGLFLSGVIEAGIADPPTAPTNDGEASGAENAEGSAEGLINDPGVFAKRCKKRCINDCSKVPLDCELIGENVPVNCNGPKEECVNGCEGYCTCQFQCGCRRVEGCDDDCSHECRKTQEGVGKTTTTTVAPVVESQENLNNPNRVIYKQDTTTHENA